MQMDPKGSDIWQGLLDLTGSGHPRANHRTNFT